MKSQSAPWRKWLFDDGEVGCILAARDWSTHALGSPDGWQAGLGIALQIALTSRQPMLVWWGEGLHQFYNDACLTILRGRHPACLAVSAPDAWPDLWETLGPPLRAARAGQRTTATACVQPDRPIRFVCSPLLGEAGRVDGVVGVCREEGTGVHDDDPMEKQLAVAALEDADRRKDEFLATLAHELRNPLAPLRNALYLLQLREHAVEAQPIHDIMDRQVRQLARLVDDLLDVSRVTRGKIGLQRCIVELGSVVDAAVEASQPLLDAARHTFTVTLPEAPVHVDGDPTRLAQVFTNLLNNAAKFTDPGGRVWLAAERRGNELLVTVGDSGIGIPADLLSEVFEMFRQLELPLEHARGGLGIGLTLVKRLVQMHGGIVEAHSEGVGLGARFVVKLPVAQAPSGGRPLLPGARSGRGVAGPVRRIVVVDDNVDSAQSLALLLRWLGHDVQVAHDGESGLSAALRHQPHLVFLDIGLPGISGHEVARRLRAQFAPSQMRLVAMTGYGQANDRLRSSSAGFDQHLVKPVEWPAIEATLTTLDA
jgi:signal transduction histidine kinase